MGQKSVYDLGLHETTGIDGNEDGFCYAMRVPGGWLYENADRERRMILSTFVPYSDEFNSSAPSSSFSPAQKWLDKSDEQLRLQLGELTPDDIRLVRAVLGAVAREGEA